MEERNPGRSKLNLLVRTDLVERVKHAAVDRKCWPAHIVTEALDNFFAEPIATAAAPTTPHQARA